MTLVLIFIALALLAAALFVVLGLAAARRADSGPDPLEWLQSLRSPSGSRFFPTEESARDLVEDLEDVPPRS
jgi:hypothetical protein